jgi:hypothetical protein
LEAFQGSICKTKISTLTIIGKLALNLSLQNVVAKGSHSFATDCKAAADTKLRILLFLQPKLLLRKILKSLDLFRSSKANMYKTKMHFEGHIPHQNLYNELPIQVSNYWRGEQ